ncbi:MAG: hypothetical protein R3F15_05055 [Lysobacterales bacterium]
MTEIEQLQVESRFRGPPDSANGGYLAGLLARVLGGVVTVRLQAPPPLHHPLSLERSESGLQLRAGEQPVAQARAAELDLQAPVAPSLAEAIQASEHYVGFREHPFPGCFVCGPARAEGDGLRIFPGRVGDRDLVAAPWHPTPDLADSDGNVAVEHLWAALDCSGFFAFAEKLSGRVALLGELTARIDAAVAADQPVTVVGWPIGQEGRKCIAGSALYDAEGQPLAVARATWIVLNPPGGQVS